MPWILRFTDMKKMIIAGANGFLGKYLIQWFYQRGWEVVGLSRNGGVTPEAKDVHWDGRTMGDWVAEFEGAEVLVNLAGKSVNCRYNEKNKAAIFVSRIESTKILGEAISQCQRPPRLWLNSSTATIYRHAEDRPQGEEEGELGAGFSVEVAKAWEKAFLESEAPERVKKVALRSAIVIANEPGSAFDYLRRIAWLGLGGRMGSGRQKMSWIHVDDFCGAIEWMIEREELQDFYNLSAPNPTDNAGCMAGFRRIAGRRLGMPATRWMLEIGTFLMRSESELVLKSRWVLPKRLLAEGFDFQWLDFDEALDALVKGGE
ncbi:MAG: hypothetical protein ACI9NQ_000671 [Paracoccaceae bacterium]|jgi:uncharacterized protein (TIGR01777 family)